MVWIIGDGNLPVCSRWLSVESECNDLSIYQHPSLLPLCFLTDYLDRHRDAFPSHTRDMAAEAIALAEVCRDWSVSDRKHVSSHFSPCIYVLRRRGNLNPAITLL